MAQRRKSKDGRDRAPARGRKQTGEIRAHPGKAGVITYSIRVRWQGDRINVRLGSELEGWNRPLAERKLDAIIAEIDAGVWRPPVPDLEPDDTDPLFHEFATVWIDRHRVSVASSTYDSYSHVLTRYLLPEFRGRRLTQITHEVVLRWRDRLRREAEQLKLANENDVAIIDKYGRPKRPFGPSTINEALRLLGQILERAAQSEHYEIQRNPVKGRSGLRVRKSRKPPREHLEADEVQSLLRAAELLDQGVAVRTLERAEAARKLRAQGMTWVQIGVRLECAETTAIYLARVMPDRNAPRKRRAMIAVLSFTGMRASEHTDLVWARVDHTHGRLVLEDSKSDAGVREIHLSPFVREEIALYRASLPEPPKPSDPVFAVRGGGSGDRFNLGRRLKRIAAVAAELRNSEGLAPMPTRITPHTFRRTFVTLSFQAGKDLPFVQSKVGHSNWKTTLDIYTQHSGRSVDPEIRSLLDEFLGEPTRSPTRREDRSERRPIKRLTSQ